MITKKNKREEDKTMAFLGISDENGRPSFDCYLLLLGARMV
jgi:hypothetical protein